MIMRWSSRLRRSVAALVLLSGAAFGQCGVERWTVKTGTDIDARFVDLNGASVTSVGTLAGLTKPASLPADRRLLPVETTQFVLNAVLTDYKLESDSDYHIVLSDGAGKTIIAEIPHPKCVGAGSPFAAGISNARAEFDARLKPTTSFQTANVLVQIRGVAFFDFLHGQRGVAPNGIEVHPVLDIVFGSAITSVNTAGGFPEIAPNTWIEIKGVNLAAPATGPNGLTWSGAPEFASGRMPTQLNGVSVTVNGKPAYVYYISPNQINVLTPLNLEPGAASVVVTNGTAPTAPFSVTSRAVAPSFLRFGATQHIAATHADGSLLGPASMSAPGYPFTPARPGETIVLYATGFGMPQTVLEEGSARQTGDLPSLPAIRIGGTAVEVQFAGVVSPGLYQINVVVPATATAGDNPVTADYGGLTTPAGSIIAVQQP
jgi:uncharacterized protein (TIGR03437 family)